MRIHASKSGRSSRKAGFAVVWRGREEMPGRELKFADGTSRWYGSGCVVFDTSDGRITMRVRWHRVDGVVRWVLPRDVREEAVMAIRKLQQDLDARVARGVSVTEAADYPLLLEYLTHDKYDDGTKRETSVLILACDGGTWRICLTDKDNQRTMWKTASSVQEGLGCIELALMAEDPTDWRRSADASAGRRKRS